MKIQKFYGETVEEVQDKIAKELGAKAVILTLRKKDSLGWKRFFQSKVEIVAASDSLNQEKETPSKRHLEIFLRLNGLETLLIQEVLKERPKTIQEVQEVLKKKILIQPNLKKIVTFKSLKEHLKADALLRLATYFREEKNFHVSVLGWKTKALLTIAEAKGCQVAFAETKQEWKQAIETFSHSNVVLVDLLEGEEPPEEAKIFSLFVVSALWKTPLSLRFSRQKQLDALFVTDIEEDVFSPLNLSFTLKLPLSYLLKDGQVMEADGSLYDNLYREKFCESNLSGFILK